MRALCIAVLLCVLPSMGAQAQRSQLPLVLPSAVAFDSQGNMFVADAGAHLVRELSAAGIVSVVAGTGVQGFSGDGGPATAAQLDSPMGLAVDVAGDLYISDTHNNRVRKIAANTGTITSIAGTGVAKFAGDGGLATAAALSRPTALATDLAGNLYICDSSNHRIRKIAAGTGVITTVAGNGVQGFSGDGGPATVAALDSPNALAIDSNGNLYIADTHNGRIRRVAAATGAITTIAGMGAGAGFAGDGGAASAAALALPKGVTTDANGNLYIADSANHRVRRVSAAGVITTLAGDAVQGFTGDGTTPTATSLNSPGSIALSATGALTIVDVENRRVRQIDPASGNIDTLPRTGTPPSAVADFVLASAGPVTQAVAAGTAASFQFNVTLQGAALSSPILLAVQGVPAGSTASVTPASLPPGSSNATFTLTVQTPKAAISSHLSGQVWWALLLIPGGMWRMRARKSPRLAILGASCILLALLPTGCGDRMNAGSGQSHTSTYTITVTGTATGPSGSALQHSTNVTLEVY